MGLITLDYGNLMENYAIMRKNAAERHACRLGIVSAFYLQEKKGRCRTQLIVSLHLYNPMLCMECFWQNTQKLVTVITFGERNRLTDGLE